jgi:hypothetical protein
MHGTSRRHPPVKHYLLTVPTTGGHLHAYLAVDDERYVLDTADRLVAEAIRLGSNPTTVLATPLGDAVVVREIVASHSADAARLLQTATDYHMTIFSTCSEADDRLLMAMH